MLAYVEIVALFVVAIALFSFWIWRENRLECGYGQKRRQSEIEKACNEWRECQFMGYLVQIENEYERYFGRVGK